MLDTIFSIFWGIILVLSILSIPYIIIRYEINRHQDKKKEEQGIYIRRVNRFEAYSCIFTIPFPFVAYIKVSPDGVEQRVLSPNPTVYPFNVINTVTYREAISNDDQDIVGFYTKSGEHIAAFCPHHS
ncbi:hypothetical protein [Rothia mucilaginosa]|uniref:hypothetical protein n=1 Tax=Rothia mucilaginosa TaxID=43675 RepID=UPI0028DB1C27|nr:hypothetical protein [Rothia mucilaginosa]